MSDSTRSDILQAARAILEVEPASQFSSRAVARAVGISVSVVHYHFSNREGLIRAAYDAAYYDGLLELADVLRSDLASSDPFADIVRSTTLKIYRYCRARGQLFRNFFASVIENGDLGSAYELEQQDRLLRLTAPFVAKHANVSMVEARIRVTLLTMLVARIATSSDRELKVITNSESPVSLIEEHLGSTAVRVILGRS